MPDQLRRLVRGLRAQASAPGVSRGGADGAAAAAAAARAAAAGGTEEALEESPREVARREWRGKLLAKHDQAKGQEAVAARRRRYREARKFAPGCNLDTMPAVPTGAESVRKAEGRRPGRRKTEDAVQKARRALFS